MPYYHDRNELSRVNGVGMRVWEHSHCLPLPVTDMVSYANG